MNKRIKELITQAGGHWNHGDFNMPSSVEFQEQDIEKFAELIVKECIDCARGAGLADDVAVRNGLGFNDGISEAVTHMKQHLGIE